MQTQSTTFSLRSAQALLDELLGPSDAMAPSTPGTHTDNKEKSMSVSEILASGQPVRTTVVETAPMGPCAVTMPVPSWQKPVNFDLVKSSPDAAVRFDTDIGDLIHDIRNLSHVVKTESYGSQDVMAALASGMTMPTRIQPSVPGASSTTLTPQEPILTHQPSFSTAQHPSLGPGAFKSRILAADMDAEASMRELRESAAAVKAAVEQQLTATHLNNATSGDDAITSTLSAASVHRAAATALRMLNETGTALVEAKSSGEEAAARLTRHSLTQQNNNLTRHNLGTGMMSISPAMEPAAAAAQIRARVLDALSEAHDSHPRFVVFSDEGLTVPLPLHSLQASQLHAVEASQLQLESAEEGMQIAERGEVREEVEIGREVAVQQLQSSVLTVPNTITTRNANNSNIIKDTDKLINANNTDRQKSPKRATGAPARLSRVPSPQRSPPRRDTTTPSTAMASTTVTAAAPTSTGASQTEAVKMMQDMLDKLSMLAGAGKAKRKPRAAPEQKAAIPKPNTVSATKTVAVAKANPIRTRSPPKEKVVASRHSARPGSPDVTSLLPAEARGASSKNVPGIARDLLKSPLPRRKAPQPVRSVKPATHSKTPASAPKVPERKSPAYSAVQARNQARGGDRIPSPARRHLRAVSLASADDGSVGTDVRVITDLDDLDAFDFMVESANGGSPETFIRRHDVSFLDISSPHNTATHNASPTSTASVPPAADAALRSSPTSNDLEAAARFAIAQQQEEVQASELRNSRRITISLHPKAAAETEAPVSAARKATLVAQAPSLEALVESFSQLPTFPEPPSPPPVMSSQQRMKFQGGALHQIDTSPPAAAVVPPPARLAPQTPRMPIPPSVRVTAPSPGAAPSLKVSPPSKQRSFRTYSSLHALKQKSPQSPLLAPVPEVEELATARSEQRSPLPERATSPTRAVAAPNGAIHDIRSPYRSAMSFMIDSAAVHPDAPVRGSLLAFAAPKAEAASPASPADQILQCVDATNPIRLSSGHRQSMRLSRTEPASPPRPVSVGHSRGTAANDGHNGVVEGGHLTLADSSLHIVGTPDDEDARQARLLGVTPEEYAAMLPHQRLLATLNVPKAFESSALKNNPALSFEIFSPEKTRHVSSDLSNGARQRSEQVYQLISESKAAHA